MDTPRYTLFTYSDSNTPNQRKSKNKTQMRNGKNKKKTKFEKKKAEK